MKAAGYRRIVIDLREGSFDAGSIRLAAHLASLMQIDLVGRYIQNHNVVRLAELPFAREFRLLEQEWHLLDDAPAALEAAAAAARRSFGQIASPASVNHLFEIVQGIQKSPAMEDIVVILPDHHAEATIGLHMKATLRDAAGVLFLPARVARQRGTVVFVTAGTDGAGLDTAKKIAASAGERLLRMEPPQGLAFLRGSDPSQGEARLVVFGTVPADMDLLQSALRSQIPFLVLREDQTDEGQSKD